MRTLTNLAFRERSIQILPGQYFDQETNLHYNSFRDYDPATGRYVQSDPAGLFGGTNPYLYVGGNPLSFRDLLGLFRVDTSNQSPDWTPAQREQYFQYVEVLRKHGRRIQETITRACALDRLTMQRHFDRWIVSVDPNVVRRFAPSPTDFANTLFKAGTTTFHSTFFREQSGFLSPQNPGQDFIFAHEFRHLFEVNYALRGPTFADLFRGYNPNEFPREQDADRFARDVLNGCPCGTTAVK